jgi:hypothetical protein
LDTWGLGAPFDAKVADELVDPAGGYAGEIAVGDDRDERLLRSTARLEQPVREIGAGAQLGDGEVDRADPRVPPAGPIAVAAVGAVLAALAVGGIAGDVHVSTHERLGHLLHDVAQQVRLGVFQLLAKPGRKVHRGTDHRLPPQFVSCRTS